MFRVGSQMADTQISMSLRLGLDWLYSKKKWKGSSILPQLHKGFSIMFLSGDAACSQSSMIDLQKTISLKEQSFGRADF